MGWVLKLRGVGYRGVNITFALSRPDPPFLVCCFCFFLRYVNPTNYGIHLTTIEKKHSLENGDK